MSKHARQQHRRARITISKLERGNVSLAMHRFERTGHFPSYSTPAERSQAARLMRQGYTWFDLHLESKESPSL